MKQAKRSPTLTVWFKKLFESILLLQCTIIKLLKFNDQLVCTFCSMTRMCTRTTTFSDGSTIPKGTQVFLPFKALHHDSKYWEDPKKFNPDRLVITDKLDFNVTIYRSTFPTMHHAKVHSRGESQASCYSLFTIWLWPSQLHWDEVCSFGG